MSEHFAVDNCDDWEDDGIFDDDDSIYKDEDYAYKIG
jgi:hypothetical protein